MASKKPLENRQEARRKENRRLLYVVGNKQQAMASQFGLAIRIKRQKMGITQTELAKLAGINRSYLSELEQGKAGISLERAERLAKTLNCELRELI